VDLRSDSDIATTKRARERKQWHTLKLVYTEINKRTHITQHTDASGREPILALEIKSRFLRIVDLVTPNLDFLNN
jgi:hypothetical protein